MKNTYLKILSLIWVLWVGSLIPARAQNEKSRQKIEAAKIGLISERLGLTPNEAERFWPIYNEYSRKRRENHSEFRQRRRNYNPETATEKETKEILDLGRRTKARELELDHEYSDKMLGVINSKQLLSLHEAEREFKERILRRLEQRRTRQNQNQEDQFRRQNNERLRNKRFN